MKRRRFAVLLGGMVCALMAQGQGAGHPAIPPAGHGMGTSHHALIKVMILDGQSAGAYHNWRLTTPVLRKELEDTGLFEVTVVTAPASDQDFSSFQPDLSHYKAIVMNYDAPEWPTEM